MKTWNQSMPKCNGIKYGICYNLTPCYVLMTLYLDGSRMLLNISIACWYLILSINPSKDNLLLEQYKSLFLNQNTWIHLVSVAYKWEVHLNLNYLPLYIYKLVIWLTQFLNSLVTVQDVTINKFHIRTSWPYTVNGRTSYATCSLDSRCL